MDRGAAVLFADAAERAGVRRFLVVSSMGADREPPEGNDPVFAAYLRAKGAADAYVRARAGAGLDDPAPGPADRRPRHRPGARWPTRPGRGEVPRDDVAAVLAELLDEPGTTAGRWS